MNESGSRPEFPSPLPIDRFSPEHQPWLVLWMPDDILGCAAV